MLQVLTPEQVLEGDTEKFSKLRPGSLFSCWLKDENAAALAAQESVSEHEHYFLVVRREGVSGLSAIDLNDENRAALVDNRQPETTTLSFDNMECINVHRE